MNTEKEKFFTRERLPSRLIAREAAWLINCEEWHLWILIRAGLLEPLGRPSQNATKYFATSSLLEKLDDFDWNSQVTACISEYWASRNSAKLKRKKTTSKQGA